MNCLTLLFIIISLAYGAQASGVSLMMPEHVFMNHDIHGRCVSHVSSHFIIRTVTTGNSCKLFKIIKQKNEETNTFYCTDFVIKNVTATCQYQCASGNLHATKQVVVADAWILPTPLNISTFEYMPVKLNCTVKTNAKTNVQSKYKLIWIKGDEFVNGNGYSIETTPFDSNTNTQNHFLTIHKASPSAYTCMLISTTREVIDSKTQHVTTEKSLIASSMLKDLAQFFKWN